MTELVKLSQNEVEQWLAANSLEYVLQMDEDESLTCPKMLEGKRIFPNEVGEAIVLAHVPKYAPIAISCSCNHSGSEVVAKKLEKFGYTHITVLMYS